MNSLERRRIPKHDSHRLEVSTPSTPHLPIPEIIVHPPPEASEPFVAEALAEAEQAVATSGTTATEPKTTTTTTPLWLCHILATFVQKRLLELYDPISVTGTKGEDARTEFERFWTWMTTAKTETTADQTKDDGQASSSEDDIPLMQLRARHQQQVEDALSSSDSDQDLPVSRVTVKRSMRNEAFALLSSRDYFAAHDKKWWAAQLSDIEGLKKVAWRERRRNGKLMREKSRQREDSGEAEDGQLDGDGEFVPDESEDSGSDGGSEVVFEMLDPPDGAADEEEDAEEGGMMELDDAELTDEGIEDISSDEELYGHAFDHGKVGGTRVDSHQV